MRKFISKALAIALGCSTLFMVGCGDNSNKDTNNEDNIDESKVTVIRAINFDGGVGTKWLKEAGKRFEAKVADVSYEEGKKGVYVKVAPNMSLSSGTMNTAGYHIYFDEAASSIPDLAQKDFLLDITDIVTAKDEDRNGTMISIEDKINEIHRAECKGSDGKYYGVPHYQWHPGAVYDRETFDKYNFYFADNSETNVTVHKSKYGEAKFIKKADGKKSCGSDGEFGTQDDGLPSSLEEFIILCSYMKKFGVTPISVSGMYKNMTNYLVEGLWASLAGYEEMRTAYDITGEINVVTGFTNENLFQGIDYIKKPTVEKKVITKENMATDGRFIYDSAARYYATSFIEIMQKEGWMSKDSTTDTVSHTDAQNSFIFGGKFNKDRIGILIEGSYWYNESVKCENFKDYFEVAKTDTRDVRFLPLPTSLNESGIVGTNRQMTYIDSGLSFGFINNNIKEQKGLVKACKEFMKFLYSDEELRAMTVTSGTKRALDYDLTEEDLNKLSVYQKDMLELVDKGRIIYASADNPTFKASAGNLHLNIFNNVFYPRINNKGYTSYYTAVLAGHTTEAIFEATKLSSENWSSLYVAEEK